MLITQLIAARAAAIASMEKLNKTSLEENRVFTEAEQAQYDDLNAEQGKLKTQIATAENQEKLNAEMNETTSQPFHAPVVDAVVQGELLDDKKEFKNLGEFLNAVKSGGHDARLNFVSEQSMGTGSEGGFFTRSGFLYEKCYRSIILNKNYY